MAMLNNQRVYKLSSLYQIIANEYTAEAFAC
jgi:hypothetical protein